MTEVTNQRSERSERQALVASIPTETDNGPEGQALGQSFAQEIGVSFGKRSLPAPCIGLRMQRRVDGSAFLAGIASQAFTVPAGARVQLRRLRADGDASGPSHCIVFAPPVGKLTAEKLEQAVADASWFRRDERHDGEVQP